MKAKPMRDRSIDELSKYEVMLYSFLMGLFLMAVIQWQIDRHDAIYAHLDRFNTEFNVEQQRAEERRLYDSSQAINMEFENE